MVLLNIFSFFFDPLVKFMDAQAVLKFLTQGSGEVRNAFSFLILIFFNNVLQSLRIRVCDHISSDVINSPCDSDKGSLQP